MFINTLIIIFLIINQIQMINVNISLKGIWIKDDSYDLYWSLSECEIIKL